MEKRRAGGGESERGISFAVTPSEFNVAVDHRVLPDRLSRAVALPGIHRLAIGSRPARDPRQELDHQRVC